jgi:Flavin containing amine oxidoreductase
MVFLCILARLVTTCEDRWNEELEQRSWLEQVMPSGARQRSANYRRLCAIGLTRSFVATRAEEMNARTGGKILLQLLYDSYFGPPIRRAPDRALNGPTTEVWIDPWQTMLDQKGVKFRTCREVVGLDVANGWISGIRWQPAAPPAGPGGTPATPGGTEATPAETPPASGEPQPEAGVQTTGPQDFDWYVLAVPCEVLKQILVESPQVMRADPKLERVFQLKTRWMNGIVFGLPGKLMPPLPKGHVLCLDSQWALTLVDQSAFWSDDHLKLLRPRWQTLLSIDVSDWDTPGIDEVPAKWTSDQNELVTNLWQQLSDHLPELPSVAPTDCNLDTHIHYGPVNPGAIAVKRTNDEPLLINTPGSWANRPKARTRIPNMFVAGDFARTHTNFASMEAANEAARRAVNELLRESGFDGVTDPCTVKNLEDPDVPWFKIPADLARAVDTVFYALGLPLRPPFRLPMAAWITLGTVTRLKRPLDRVTSGLVPRRFW